MSTLDNTTTTTTSFCVSLELTLSVQMSTGVDGCSRGLLSVHIGYPTPGQKYKKNYSVPKMPLKIPVSAS